MNDDGRVLSKIWIPVHCLHYVLVQLLGKKSMKMYNIILDALIFITDRCHVTCTMTMDACINNKKGDGWNK